MGKIRVVQYGLGPIGCELVRQMLARRGLEVVGGVDIDPAKVGRDIGDVADVGRDLGTQVIADPIALIESSKPDIVTHTTSSSLKAIRSQLELLVRAGVDVITTCEEAAFPSLLRR